MADSIKDQIINPKPARLIPSIADSKKEERATSIFLSALTCIRPLANQVLNPIGQNVGTRAKIECFREVDLKEKPQALQERPDGLIVVSTGQREWAALVEAKVEKEAIAPEQIESYVRLGKANGINALITISNQFTARPDHVPYKISGHATRNFDLFHFSWKSIRTQILLTSNDDNIDIDPMQRLIAHEVLKYLIDPSSGVRDINQMNREWKDVVIAAKSGGSLATRSDAVINTVRQWHEEQRDICLILSERLNTLASVRLKRTHAANADDRVADDAKRLSEENELFAEIDIPNAASPLTLHTNLANRVINCSMALKAPEDKQRYTSRLSWLLRQLPTELPDNVKVTVHWPGRSRSTDASVKELRDDPSRAQSDNQKLLPTGFEVSMWVDAAGKYSGRKTFVSCLEDLVVAFYDTVGQHVRQWQPKPPKPVPETKRIFPDEIMEPAKHPALDESFISSAAKPEGDPEKPA